MLSQSGERTLISAIIPPDVAHTNGVRSYAYNSFSFLLNHAAMAVSLPFDFMCKSTGKANLHQTLDDFPLINFSQVAVPIWARVLSLSCITNSYTNLWQTSWDSKYRHQRWSIPQNIDHVGSHVLQQDFFSKLTPKWQRNCALRSDYVRRQALLEIDVLVAQAMNMTLNELLTIYRVQFPVLQQNDRDTWYDQNGRIVFTCNIGLAGVGLPRKARKSDLQEGIRYGIDSPDRTLEDIALGWEDIANLQSGQVTKTFMDDTLPGGPTERTITYLAPFFKPNREEDYRIAWEFFAGER
jgi:hypothetical protein